MNRKAMYPLVFSTAALAMCFGSLPLFASDNDDKIVSSFEQTYVYKTYLKDDAVKAKAKDGAVTLSGTVAEESHKALAQETVSNLPGVLSVDNQLATKAEAAADNSDKWIGRKVSVTLFFHRHVNASKTDVTVKDGVVTLKGEAESVAQKDLTAEYAKDIDGVKDVKNLMTVSAVKDAAGQTAGQKIDDASVTAQVKTALLSHRSTSAVNTKVTTLNGEVTLTGVAKNSAERTLVTKLVTDIQGVSSVNNKMTVQ